MTIQGEFHSSEADRLALLSRITEETDAVFVEGREDSFQPSKWTVGYLFFLFGVIQIYWMEDYLSTDDIADHIGTPVHQDIDAPLPELYENHPVSWKLVSAILAMVLLIVGLYIPQFPFPIYSVPESIQMAYSGILKLIILAFSPILYSFLLIYSEERFIEGRDDHMAEAIIEVSDEQGYEDIVVLCGEAHTSTLSERLERRGWQVKVYHSENSHVAKLWK